MNKRDFYDVLGQQAAKRAFEVAAAGNHNLLMIGPPGSGKTMLAIRMAGILPPLEDGKERPFQAPHHTCNIRELLGTPENEGAASKANKGVMLLDELPEFPSFSLSALALPIYNKRIVFDGGIVRESDFLLIGAMNPCPCGFRDDFRRVCFCTTEQVKRYQSVAMSRTVRKYFPIVARLTAVPYKELVAANRKETSEIVRARVVATRAFAATHKDEHLSADCGRLMHSYGSKIGFTARSYVQTISVARTIASMEGSERIGVAHLAEACQYSVDVATADFLIDTKGV